MNPATDLNGQGRQDNVQELLKDVGHVGLQNIGNTCFMNSGLQVLLSSKHLVQAVMDSEVCQNSKSNDGRNTNGAMYAAFRELITASTRDKSTVYRPYKIKNAASMLNRAFIGYGQQDSFELIQAVLDGLEKETNMAKGVPYRSLDTDGMSYYEARQMFREYHYERYNSPITRVTCTELAKCVMCTECQYKSYSFSYCQALLLDLVVKKSKSDGQRKAKGKGAGLDNNSLDIDSLIANSEKVYTVENYYCARCKSHGDVNVREWISEPAKCLIIQFKRFRDDRNKPFYHFFSGYSKNDAPVKYGNSLSISCLEFGQNGVEQNDMQPDRTCQSSEVDSSTDQLIDVNADSSTDKTADKSSTGHASQQSLPQNKDNDESVTGVPSVLPPTQESDVKGDKDTKDIGGIGSVKPPKGKPLGSSGVQSSKTYEYKYRGASLHSGGLGGGHYTALCYGCNDKYYYCNDSSITQLDKGKLDEHAYVLIFDRVD